MKQIIETKMVEQTTTRFISDNGKEFNTEEECKRYEYTLNREQVERDFQNLNCEKLTPFIFDWWNDMNMYACEITSKKDIYTLETYFGSKFDDYKFTSKEKIYFTVSDSNEFDVMKTSNLKKYIKEETENISKLKEFFANELENENN